MPWMIRVKDGIKIKIRVQPRSSKSAIGKLHDDRLKIYVTSPPVDDKANNECVRLFAKTLHHPRSEIEVTSGKTSRNKTVLISGADSDFIKSKIIV